MKLKVLGSSSMSSMKNSASYLIDDKILIDVPNGITKVLKRFNKDISNINTVLITHFHGDHYFDIPFFLYAKAKFDRSNLNILCNQFGRLKILFLTKLAFPNSIFSIRKKIKIKYNYKRKINFGNYIIEKKPIRHVEFLKSYGYIFNTGNNKILFTGDCYLNDLLYELIEKCNYVVCDCTLLAGNNRHMGVDNIEELSKRYENITFLTSHMSDKARSKLKKLKLKNVIVLEDGDEIKID